jgi:hypothetical protein
MHIVEALRSEEAKLNRQLTAIQGAIAALNGGKTAAAPDRTGSATNTSVKRTMSAAVKAKIARSARERWAKIRAEKAKKASKS